MSKKMQPWTERFNRAETYKYQYGYIDRFVLDTLRVAFENLLNEDVVNNTNLVDAVIPLYKMSGSGRNRPSTILTAIQKYLLEDRVTYSGTVIACCILGLAGGEEGQAFKELYNLFNVYNLQNKLTWTIEQLFYWARNSDQNYNTEDIRFIERCRKIKQTDDFQWDVNYISDSCRDNYPTSSMLYLRQRFEKEDQENNWEPLCYGPDLD